MRSFKMYAFRNKAVAFISQCGNIAQAKRPLNSIRSNSSVTGLACARSSSDFSLFLTCAPKLPAMECAVSTMLSSSVRNRPPGWSVQGRIEQIPPELVRPSRKLSTDSRSKVNRSLKKSFTSESAVYASQSSVCLRDATPAQWASEGQVCPRCSLSNGRKRRE